MKTIFFLGVLLFSITAVAQVKLRYYANPENKDNKINVLPFQKMNGFDSLQTKIMLSQKFNSSMLGNNILFTLPNNSKVYLLPQDNMPCLVPDISRFNMPNILKGVKISGMPPGSLPQNIFPEKNE